VQDSGIRRRTGALLASGAPPPGRACAQCRLGATIESLPMRPKKPRRVRPESPAAEQGEAEKQSTDVRLCVLLEQNGACPFEAWLYALSDRAAQARIVMRLLRVSQGHTGDHRERIAAAISDRRI